MTEAREPSAVVWTFLHLLRVTNGKTIEHWGRRDDVDLLRQVGASTGPLALQVRSPPHRIR